MKTQVKRPDGIMVELYYYELEEFCKEQVRQYIHDAHTPLEQSLEREKEFLEFAKQYQTFSPYFDFVFSKLGYILYYPFFTTNTQLKYVEERGVYYMKYLACESNLDVIDRFELEQPLIPLGIEEGIHRTKITERQYPYLSTSFINEQMEAITVKGVPAGHDYWARIWVHSMLIRSKIVCEAYLYHQKSEVALLYYNQGLILQEFYPWLRLSLVTVGQNQDEYQILYHKEKITREQRKFVRALQKRNLLHASLLIDISKDGEEL